MQIKVQLGKLELNLPLADMIDSQRENNGVEVLPIATKHILALGGLAAHHKAPFDRLLIAQSEVEGLTIVTRDTKFPAYGAKLLW